MIIKIENGKKGTHPDRIVDKNRDRDKNRDSDYFCRNGKRIERVEKQKRDGYILEEDR